MDASSCSSDRDLVTLVDWVDEAPNIMINFRDDPQKPGRLNCYNGASLEYWLSQKENTFAEWVQRREDDPMEEMGYGGVPDPDRKYVKLYTGEFVVNDRIVSDIKHGVNYPIILDADYIGTKRIGNLRGEFGIGDIHGQLPGYRVYQLKTNAMTRIAETEEDEEEDVPESDTDKVQLDADNLAALKLNEYRSPRLPEFGLALDEYLSQASRAQRESLATKMIFMVVPEVEGLSDVRSEASRATTKIRPYLRILYSKIGVDPERAEDEAVMDHMVVGTYMRHIAGSSMVKDLSEKDVRNIAKEVRKSSSEVFRELPKELVPIFYLIEGIARPGGDFTRDLSNQETLTRFMENLSKLLSSEESVEDFGRSMMARKVLVAIAARSRVSANYTITEDILSTAGDPDESWGIAKDKNRYMNIANTSPQNPDTFDNMRAFYKEFKSTTLGEFKNLI